MGYDLKSAQPSTDARAEPQIDLEAELLSELHGFDEPAQSTFDHSSAAEAPAGESEAESEPVIDLDDVSLDEDHLSDEMMTISLEDELLREFDVEQATDADTWTDEAVPADSVSEALDIAAPEPQSGEEAAFQSAEPAEDDGGFAFPSMDELEEDPEFAGASWDHAEAVEPLVIQPDSIRQMRDEDSPPVVLDGHEAPAEHAAAYQAPEFSPQQESEQETGAPLIDSAPAAELPEMPESEVPESERSSEDIAEGLPEGFAEDREPEARSAFHDVAPEGLVPPEDDLAAGAGPQDESLQDDVSSSPLEEAAAEEPGDPASSDDILAEISRFDFSLDDDDAGSENGGSEAVASPEATEETEDEAVPASAAASIADPASALDDWLRAAMETDREPGGDPAPSGHDEVSGLGQPLDDRSSEASHELDFAAPGASDATPVEATDFEFAGEETAEAAEISDEAPSSDPVMEETSPVWSETSPAVDAAEQENEPEPAPDAGVTSSFAASGIPESDRPVVFDAAAITEHDEVVEAMPSLDIPRLPEEEKKTESLASDGDFDFVDADFMGLLSEEAPAGSEPVAEEEEPAPPIAAEEISTAVPIGIDTAGHATAHFEDAGYHGIDFDDLERALDVGPDEDRAEAAPRSPDPIEETILPPAGAAALAAKANHRRGRGGKRLMVTAAGIVVIAAVGVLVWNAGGPEQAASNSPRIIAADTTPVKQKPKDPGGKTVPNQNKIVYDRVDGTENGAPQQKELLASAEKPVDVVQRTLQPDQPDNASAAKPAAGTPQQGVPAKGQARLSPDTKKAISASPESAMPSGVQPHFVRTMTVTADGKLVPVTQKAPNAPAASSAPAAEASPPATMTKTPEANAPAIQPSAPSQASAAAPSAPAANPPQPSAPNA
ncbi:MAG TPA: hypothetical protein VFJ18_06280, partial [Pararhizobium sp.]|nr:hypothetical protein [Pararhizobium sp.]